MIPNQFQALTAIVSLIAGLSSLAATLASVLIAWTERIRKLREAKHQRLNEVLDSSDLGVVGSYLDEVIGGFNVYEYVTAEDVATTVDRYLDKLKWFVSTDADIARAAELAGGGPEPEDAVGMADELKTALREVRWGEVWNGLARLRRHIELRLRSIAARGDYWADKTSSAGALLRAAVRLEVISEEDYDWLASAVAVCNEAVHGGDVGRDQAERAVRVAAAVLGRLDPPRGPEAHVQ